MPLLPKNEKNDSFLPNPMENFSVSEAYSSVYKAVIEASTTSNKDSTNDDQEIPFSFPIGYASTLINFALACIVDAEKIIEELKEMQAEVTSSKPDELEEKLMQSNAERISKVQNLVEMTNKTCFDIKLFERKRQSFSLVLNGKITKKLNFSLPDASNVFNEIRKLTLAESFTEINFEQVEKEISNLKQALTEEHSNIKQAKDSVAYQQIDSSIADIDEAKSIIDKLKDTMINKPKLINLNQSNISKNKLINIRKL